MSTGNRWARTTLVECAWAAAAKKDCHLKERFRSEHWRIYEVTNPKPLVEPLGTGRANTVRIGPQGFALDVTSPGEFLVRVSFTPYWSIGRGAGCPAQMAIESDTAALVNPPQRGAA